MPAQSRPRRASLVEAIRVTHTRSFRSVSATSPVIAGCSTSAKVRVAESASPVFSTQGRKVFVFCSTSQRRGLHESDLSELALCLGRLRGKHTIILNEHRERLWDIADWFVEVGPGAGASGGEITYAGSHRKREHR